MMDQRINWRMIGNPKMVYWYSLQEMMQWAFYPDDLKMQILTFNISYPGKPRCITPTFCSLNYICALSLRSWMEPTCIHTFIPMSLTSIIGSCRLLCYRTPVEVEWLLSLTRYRKYITVLSSLGKYKWWKGKIVTGQGYGLGIGGCKRLCPTANGA